MEKNTDFAALVADGHSRIIQNNLKIKYKIEILTTPVCANCGVVKKMLDEISIETNNILSLNLPVIGFPEEDL